MPELHMAAIKLNTNTSTHHYLKVDMTHATRESRGTCPFYLRQTTPHPGDTKIEPILQTLIS